MGRTGLAGRGLLGKWGPNHAADPIVTRFNPLSSKLQFVAIKRKDTGEWALPGGLVGAAERGRRLGRCLGLRQRRAWRRSAKRRWQSGGGKKGDFQGQRKAHGDIGGF